MIPHCIYAYISVTRMRAHAISVQAEKIMGTSMNVRTTLYKCEAQKTTDRSAKKKNKKTRLIIRKPTMQLQLLSEDLLLNGHGLASTS